MEKAMDYSKICFVIMPFGPKEVGGRKVEFDKIYDEIFVPAIKAVALPEGGSLEPRRTDKDFFAGDIKLDMFRYLEYSRFALADISGLNFNVAYELGARHRVREAGTAIFRQAEAPIPFDISSIKAFPYEYEPADNAEKSRAMITRVLSESLAQNRLDSPVQIALKAQRQSGNIEELLKDAENAIRNQDWNAAMAIYRQAVAIDPENPLPRMKLGILCRDRSLWDEALSQFNAAIAASPAYGEAYREKGIAENKLAAQRKEPMDANPAPGETALRRAVELNGADFDALASLGGVLKRAKRFKEAHQAYERSTTASGGHPYPLLNALKLRAVVQGRLDLKPSERRALARAEHVRELQTRQSPPYDRPWSFFDLAEIKLYRGDKDGFLSIVDTCLEQTDDDWQGRTFLDSLRLLQPVAGELPGLAEGIARLEEQLA
jgi:tetratricopeptide (TPR) repeat protein